MKANYFTYYLQQQTKIASLVVFRMFFGIMMFASIVRFWANGWIEELYLQPKFHFKYYFFSWVQPLGNYTYLLFILCALSAICIAVGYKYKLSTSVFFLSFLYIELMDKTTYLNHYYFISILSFLMIFLPANANFSLDAYKNKKIYNTVPKWSVDSIKFLLGIVYFYAGLAKLNSDWLFRAMPLKIWLPSKYDIPLLGNTVMQQEWFHYAMSWSGMLYDLTIPFFLLYKRTRIYAFVVVVIFHVFTRVLFPIGMFPFIMIISTLIFFEASFHQKIITTIKKIFNITTYQFTIIENYRFSAVKKRITHTVLAVFMILQLLFPFRNLLYPGELFWTEQGFRFSWRVMLMEKAGNTTFKVVNTKTNAFFYVDNKDFLTSFQEKQMSFQPDFILEYAHFLGDHFKNQGHKNIAIYADSFVALNGRLSTRFVDKTINLYAEKESFAHKKWILPFTSEIKIKGI